MAGEGALLYGEDVQVVRRRYVVALSDTKVNGEEMTRI
jgi:hypothetical protein